jgi:hypothetical protein
MTVLVRTVCLGCGVVFEPAGDHRLSPDFRARIAARLQLGRSGTWGQLGLPSMRRIGMTVGDARHIVKVCKTARFFKYDWENLADADLFGTVRSRLGLGRGMWPRAITSPAWDRPVILHHGIAEKLANKRDNSHLHLVSLVPRTIAEPAEAWIDDYGGSRNVHLFGRYAIGREVVAQMVCVDTATALCTTAYHHDPGSEDTKRRGHFLYASWAAPE